ncbi:hypothetical protein CFOL_v3_25570 [Cephalotus follicularis]|uniref:Uncharacterized protein n=1 Tax=Cephalotus follicularis TaxID=3775 RepID=A0A1Q3CPG2_CEPFO|nr:hypothetical protein CFOL_v3_25570 [Cephalotus follicularis]
MKKLIPIAATRIRRTGRDGCHKSSLHTPCPRQLLVLVAALVISPSLSSASSVESDTLIKTRLASPILPLRTSQRGDSGMAMTAKPMRIDGIAARPNISLQLMCAGNPDKE